jgi:hypothetical protein
VAVARAAAPRGSVRSAGMARTLRALARAVVVALSGTLFSAACGEIKPARLAR